jgi:SAM-dependent methyltransferase
MCVRRWGLITVKSALGADLQVSDWVIQHASIIRPGGRVLDYACGHGRHALYLAAQGYEVLAIDRNPQVLQEITDKAHQLQLNVETQLIDLEQNNWPFSGSEFAKSFDGVVVTNYLYRPFLMRLSELLKDDGVLIYETFGFGNEAFGKPSNPNFLLRPNELLGFSEKMKILAYEDLQIQLPKPACIQRICAVPLQSKT